MRVLLSAYACEPGKGSEPAVGWNWAIELARLGHEVWVVTRANNRQTIEASAEASAYSNLHFVYVDLPPAIRRFKKGRRGMTLYYMLWQWAAYRVARRLIREHAFDYVHHVTFVAVRQPSFMGLLGVPFILGPIGGGESTPPALRRSFCFKDRVFEALRSAANVSVRVNPLQWLTFATADHIFVTSAQTLALIPRVFRRKSQVQLGIGVDALALDSSPPVTHAATAFSRSGGQSLRILYAGNLLHWKGIHLALHAFAQARQSVPSARLTIVGTGNAEPWLRSLAAQLDITDAIDWLGQQPRSSLLDLYSQYDIFLYPSLHDSGAMVVLESLRAGLPVVALDLGGPGVVVNDTCGRLIAAQHRSEREVTHALAQAVVELASPAVRLPLRPAVLQRASEFTWQRLVTRVSACVDTAATSTCATSECTLPR